MKVKDFVINNWFIRKAYSCRFYLNLGIAQISWFSGKLPEIMAFVYLSDWLGFDLDKQGLLVFAIGVIVGLTIMGYIWKHTGLYDTEIYVNVDKNPVAKEMLEAARLIKREYGDK